MTSIPLVRMLTDAGYGSRRDASKLINAGLVEVNGRPASSYTEKVDPEVDSIVVTGTTLPTGMTRRIYILMNKPQGYLATTEDDRDRDTVLDLLPQHMRTAGIHPAGRLDEDTTGLLILTNDGQLTYELTHPRFEHEKEYWVATTGRLTDADVAQLEEGVEIEGQMTWPAKVKLLLGQSPYTYSITIHEGRKRQVRMMFAAINQQVALLKRVRMGGLLLGDLAEGSWRELTSTELKDLMKKRPPEGRPSPARERAGRTDARRGSMPTFAAPGTNAVTRRQGRVTVEGEQADTVGLTQRQPPVHSVSPSAGDRVRVWRSSDERRDWAPRAEGRGPNVHSADSRPFVRRDMGAPSERPFGRPSDDGQPRSLERRESGARGQRIDQRREPDSGPFPRHDAAPGRKYPFRRASDDSGPRSFRRRENGSRHEPASGAPMREPDQRSFNRRDAGPRQERPFARSENDRGTRSFERRDSHSSRAPRSDAPVREHNPGPFARRDASPAPERPFRRASDSRGPRSFERSDFGSRSAPGSGAPARGRGSMPVNRRDAAPAMERPFRRSSRDSDARASERRDTRERGVSHSNRSDAGSQAERVSRRPSTDRGPRSSAERRSGSPQDSRSRRPQMRGRDDRRFERGDQGPARDTAYRRSAERRSAGPEDGYRSSSPRGGRVREPDSRLRVREDRDRSSREAASASQRQRQRAR